MHLRPSICFFTVVMNRLQDLRETLPVNLRDNKCAETTFFILDYDSHDGLNEYLVENFRDELKQGRLKYLRYSPVEYFSQAHSRNLSVQQINAEYICNLDADNFSGHGFDQYLQETFGLRPGAVITGLDNNLKSHGAFGRMAVARQSFLDVGGYDEGFTGYGFEDYDLISRLKEKGCSEITIDNPNFLQVLPKHHDAGDTREWTGDHLERLYRQQILNELQVLLYLFNDETFHYGIVHETITKSGHHRYTLAGNAWQSGRWSETDSYLELHFLQFTAKFEKRGDYLTDKNHQMKREIRQDELKQTVLFHSSMVNASRYRENKRKKIIRVNEHGFGQGSTQPLPTKYLLKT